MGGVCEDWEKGLCWCTIPLVESGVEDQICLRLYDALLRSKDCVWYLRKYLGFEFVGRKSGFEFSVWGPNIWIWFLCLMFWWCGGLNYGFESGFEFKFLNLGLNLIFWVLNLLGLCSWILILGFSTVIVFLCVQNELDWMYFIVFNFVFSFLISLKLINKFFYI